MAYWVGNKLSYRSQTDTPELCWLCPAGSAHVHTPDTPRRQGTVPGSTPPHTHTSPHLHGSGAPRFLNISFPKQSPALCFATRLPHPPSVFSLSLSLREQMGGGSHSRKFKLTSRQVLGEDRMWISENRAQDTLGI